MLPLHSGFCSNGISSEVSSLITQSNTALPATFSSFTLLDSIFREKSEISVIGYLLKFPRAETICVHCHILDTEDNVETQILVRLTNIYIELTL